MGQAEELKKVNRVYRVRNLAFISSIACMIVAVASAVLNIATLFYIMLTCTAFSFYGSIYLTERASNMTVR